MRILYGLAGEGFGHSSRALVIVKYLEEQGHEVLLMTYGQAYKVLKNTSRFKVIGIKIFCKLAHLFSVENYEDCIADYL